MRKSRLRFLLLLLPLGYLGYARVYLPEIHEQHVRFVVNGDAPATDLYVEYTQKGEIIRDVTLHAPTAPGGPGTAVVFEHRPRMPDGRYVVAYRLGTADGEPRELDLHGGTTTVRLAAATH